MRAKNLYLVPKNTLEVVNFKAWHLFYLMAQGLRDQNVAPFYKPEHAYLMEKDPNIRTVLDYGVPIFVGGIREHWKGRGEAWLLFAETRSKHFMSIFRLVNKWLDSCTFTRIEATIECDFLEGHRWIKLLGFKKEAEVLRKYLPGGQDASLYARVKE